MPPEVVRVQVVTPLLSTLPVPEEARHWFSTPAPNISSPRQVADLFAVQAQSVREHFLVCHTDLASNLLAVETVAIGDMAGLELSVGEVFRSVLATGAPSLLLVHNHPSGDPTPSEQDLTTTKKLLQAANLLSLVLEDHVILCRDGSYFSFAEHGLL